MIYYFTQIDNNGCEYISKLDGNTRYYLNNGKWSIIHIWSGRSADNFHRYEHIMHTFLGKFESEDNPIEILYG